MHRITKGRVLNGKWTIGELLGSGGTGTVYEASHRNGIRAAVKVLHPALAADEDQVQRFLREGAISNHLEHIGAVAAFDDDRTDDGIVYVVFERLEGSSLAEIIEQRAPLPVTEALTLTEKILDVVAAAHAKGVIHRDIKPGNIHVLPNGDVKLIDFGLAKGQAVASDNGPNPTQNGVVFGTPGFMPPEQAAGRIDEVDERSDLWSVAALLFAMLTRRRIAEDRTPVPPIRSVRSVPEVVARIVDRGLSFERADRFQSAVRMQGAVRFALSSLLTAQGSSEPIVLPTVESPSAPRRSSFRKSGSGREALALALLAVAALVGLAWLASAAAGAEPPPRGKTGSKAIGH